MSILFDNFKNDIKSSNDKDIKRLCKSYNTKNSKKIDKLLDSLYDELRFKNIIKSIINENIYDKNQLMSILNDKEV